MASAVGFSWLLVCLCWIFTDVITALISTVLQVVHVSDTVGVWGDGGVTDSGGMYVCAVALVCIGVVAWTETQSSRGLVFERFGVIVVWRTLRPVVSMSLSVCHIRVCMRAATCSAERCMSVRSTCHPRGEVRTLWSVAVALLLLSFYGMPSQV